MRSVLFRFLSLVVVIVPSSILAYADSWTQPTPDELQMTAEPAAPGAPAIYLYLEERADDKIHIHTTYVRLKILTEKGKQYADQEINYEGREFKISGVEGRTIHSDGTVIPFTGKPYQKVVEKTGKEKYKATVFTLPDVQVGSIIEYRYTLEYESNFVVAPRWYLQGPLYTRKAHFYFLPSDHHAAGRPRRRYAGPGRLCRLAAPGRLDRLRPFEPVLQPRCGEYSRIPGGGPYASYAQLHLSRTLLLHDCQNDR